MSPGCVLRPSSLASQVNDRAGLKRVRELYHRSREVDEAVARAEQLDFDNVRDAMRDLIVEHGDKYSDGPRYLEQLARVGIRIRGSTSSTVPYQCAR